MALVNIVEKDKVDVSKHKSLRKSGNEIVKILAKSKSSNLLKSRSRNLFRFKKVQSISIIEKPNFLISDARAAFTKLRQVFI